MERSYNNGSDGGSAQSSSSAPTPGNGNGGGRTAPRVVDHTYRDFSNYLQHAGQVDRHKKVEANFPAKLHQMLSDPQFSNIIVWMPHGRAWRIVDKELLMSKIHKYFALKRFHSFIRQLSGWGFKRLHQPGLDHGCYYHECFLRGIPLLTWLMRRVPTNTGKPVPHIEGEPDFYEIAKRHPIPPVTEDRYYPYQAAARGLPPPSASSRTSSTTSAHAAASSSVLYPTSISHMYSNHDRCENNYSTAADREILSGAANTMTSSMSHLHVAAHDAAISSLSLPSSRESSQSQLRSDGSKASCEAGEMNQQQAWYQVRNEERMRNEDNNLAGRSGITRKKSPPPATTNDYLSTGGGAANASAQQGNYQRPTPNPSHHSTSTFTDVQNLMNQPPNTGISSEQHNFVNCYHPPLTAFQATAPIPPRFNAQHPTTPALSYTNYQQYPYHVNNGNTTFPNYSLPPGIPFSYPYYHHQHSSSEHDVPAWSSPTAYCPHFYAPPSPPPHQQQQQQVVPPPTTDDSSPLFAFLEAHQDHQTKEQGATKEDGGGGSGNEGMTNEFSFDF
ncbi:hypothetical protein ACHAWU_003877 [Discostella pseudostelligera]|uniref:HSF-type DNA-binding domain-containing protein n=1 Tax=Discostella pseudostelligera TaxID=259834 RepID=A0ABD3M9L0_9STRA